MKFKTLLSYFVPFIILLSVALATVINNREASEESMAQGALGPNLVAPYGVRFIDNDMKRNEKLMRDQNLLPSQ
jgi:hypothetical protein